MLGFVSNSGSALPPLSRWSWPRPPAAAATECKLISSMLSVHPSVSPPPPPGHQGPEKQWLQQGLYNILCVHWHLLYCLHQCIRFVTRLGLHNVQLRWHSANGPYLLLSTSHTGFRAGCGLEDWLGDYWDSSKVQDPPNQTNYNCHPPGSPGAEHWSAFPTIPGPIHKKYLGFINFLR